MMRKAVALSLIVIPLVAVVIALTRAELPDPVPSHWNARGAVDGTMSPTALAVMSLVVTGAAAVAAFGFARSEWPRYSLTGCAFAAYLVGAMTVMTAVVASGADAASQVRLSWPAILPAVLAALLGPAAVAALWPRHTHPTGATPEGDLPRIPLADSERVVYVSHVRSDGFRLLAAVGFLASAIVAATTSVLIGAGILAVAVAVLVLHHVTVRIDAQGLHIGFGPGLRMRVRLAEIRQATPADIRPMQWGGWGYRVMPGRRALVVRGGPGLVLDLEDGSRFAVTLDSPDEAAAVLNTLIGRHRESRPH